MAMLFERDQILKLFERWEIGAHLWLSCRLIGASLIDFTDLSHV
jgi:hypothetical protein